MTWQEAAFKTLLLLLDRDPENAFGRYRKLLVRFTLFFRAHALRDAEELAYKTMFMLSERVYSRLTGRDKEPGAGFEVPSSLEDLRVYRKESDAIERAAFEIAIQVRMESLRRRDNELSAPADLALSEHSWAPDMVLVVQEALQSLSSDERRIIEAHLLDDQTVAELAAQLGVTKSAMSNRIYRIRRKLRKTLDGTAVGTKAHDVGECRCEDFVPPIQAKRVRVSDKKVGSLAYAECDRVLEIAFKSGQVWQLADVPAGLYTEIQNSTISSFLKFVAQRYQASPVRTGLKAIIVQVGNILRDVAAGTGAEGQMALNIACQSLWTLMIDH